ncbi:MAG: hypothetical protein U5N86_06875 [Planctomycetota bacterium]|nr:hypothetical protein [Planctomycetota bacterium]
MECAEQVVGWLRRNLGLEAAIKEPNDVFVAGRKISGILVEQVDGKLVMGVGLNTNLMPSDLGEEIAATSVYEQTGEKCDNKTVARELSQLIYASLNEGFPSPGDKDR